MMLAEIASGFASLKAATDMVTAINGMMKAADVADVKLTLQRHLLDAQQSLFAAQQVEAANADRIRQLEQQIMRMEDWSGERQNYELREVYRGAFAYMKKPGVGALQPPHWLCASCFDEGKKSILQLNGTAKEPRYHLHACPTCKSTIMVSRMVTPGDEETRQHQEG